MTPREFFEKVMVMRRAQRGYFSEPFGSAKKMSFYSQARKMERIIDAEIDRVLTVLKNNKDVIENQEKRGETPKYPVESYILNETKVRHSDD